MSETKKKQQQKNSTLAPVHRTMTFCLVHLKLDNKSTVQSLLVNYQSEISDLPSNVATYNTICQDFHHLPTIVQKS